MKKMSKKTLVCFVFSILFFVFLRKNVFIRHKKSIDKHANIYYNIRVAGVAQSVVQLIRHQQVVCSSHITSSKKSSTG